MDDLASTCFGFVTIFAFLFSVANVSVIYWCRGVFEAYSQDVYANHSVPGKLVKLHTQINEVDGMLENGLNSMRKEFNEKMEELDDMDWKLYYLILWSDSFDKSVDAIGAKGLLSKEDFGQFFEEFIKTRIKGEIERHVADGLRKVDCALRLSGHPEPYDGEGHELCLVSADAGKRRWVAIDQ